MGNTIGNHKNNKTKHLTIGLLAHVDAGKTTLAETTLARFFLAFDFLTNALM